MRGPMQRGLLIGLGTLALVRERTQRVVAALAKRGEACREKASELIDGLAERGERECVELRELVEGATADIGLATSKDIKILSQKIEELTRRPEARENL